MPSHRGLLTVADVLLILRGLVHREGGQVAAAKSIGIGQSYLSQILRGERAPTPAVCARLGLERRVFYARAKHTHTKDTRK